MYETLCEHICEDCINGTDMCMPGDDIDCPFWDSFQQLEAMCRKAEAYAEGIRKSAMNNYYLERQEAFDAGNW